MTFGWTGEALEQVRHLAVLRLEEGYSQEEVAEFLGLSARTVRRWWHRWQHQGNASLGSMPRQGRPQKLSDEQTELVLSWLDCPATTFGFPTELWTAPRLAWRIQQQLGITMNRRYLNDWTRRHGVTPQMPARQGKERDEQLIQGWLHHQWPRIKKRRGS